MPMDQSLLNTHVKLLAFDLLSLTPTADSAAFSQLGKLFSHAEIVGTITSREHKPNKFVKFTIDDGTGCIPCILWINQFSSPYFSRRDPTSVRLIANVATEFAGRTKVGVVARVRGRITIFRGGVQITVSDVVNEKDPNMEVLHWLDCMRLTHESTASTL